MAPSNILAEQLKTQKEIIVKLGDQSLINGETWYLVGKVWYSRWKRYVDNKDCSSDFINKNLNPGPVDNTDLLEIEKSTLKRGLIDREDYELLPQKAWDLLVDYYGIIDDLSIIERKVIEIGKYTKQRSVEIYPLLLKYKEYNKNKIGEGFFSKVTKISKLDSYIKESLFIASNSNTRLWDATNEKKFYKLDKNLTVQDCSLQHGQLVVIEVESSDGTWPYSDSLSKPSSLNGSLRNSNYQLRNGSTSSYGSASLTPGLCGLSNLGNTCFMNSALQCLSNVPPLTDYFKSEKYKSELNRHNPLGMGGRLAEEYAHLIKTLWSGQHSSMAPRDFKMSVSQFAPRFSGYQQHDSQELVSFLIDGLHEDLNRITNKPYIEIKEAGDRPMAEVAEESWQNHRKRNDSIVVDTLHGLFRSTVDCPECPRISVTFDPFCYLSLPLPAKRERVVECFYVPLNMSEEITKYKVSVNRNGSLYDLHMALSNVNKKAPDQMNTANVCNNKFQTLYKITDLMKSVYDKEQLYVYETKNDYTAVPIYMRKSSSLSGYNQNIFGLPQLLPLKTDEAISYLHLCKSIFRAIFRHVENKDLKKKIKEFLEKKNSSLEDMQEKDEDGINLFNLFKIKSTNSSGIHEFEVFKPGADIEISAKTYLCADWSVDAYKKFILGQWANNEVLHESADPNTPRKPVGVNLHDCVKLFTTKEQLDKDDAWYCSSCKKHQQATKKFDLWMLPPVLIIHLKRFSYTRYYRDKLDTFVNFPLKNLDLTDFVVNPNKAAWPRSKKFYNLIGVSNHYGGLGGGHYTAYAKNSLDGKWHYFDDNDVSLSSEDRVVTKAAYMLIYQRQDLEEWMRKRSPSDDFPYLMPFNSPRATAFASHSFEVNEQNGQFHEFSGDEDFFNNNIDDDMEMGST